MSDQGLIADFHKINDYLESLQNLDYKYIVIKVETKKYHKIRTSIWEAISKTNPEGNWRIF